jgi:hypothetical protein
MSEPDEPPIPFPGMLTITGLTSADVGALVESYLQRRAAGDFTIGRCLWLSQGLEFDPQMVEDHETQHHD